MGHWTVMAIIKPNTIRATHDFSPIFIVLRKLRILSPDPNVNHEQWDFLRVSSKVLSHFMDVIGSWFGNFRPKTHLKSILSISNFHVGFSHGILKPNETRLIICWFSITGTVHRYFNRKWRIQSNTKHLQHLWYRFPVMLLISGGN